MRIARSHRSGVVLTVYLAWFRLFVGDLSNDVSDDVLANAFNKYTSFTKARVIRDRLSGKARLLPDVFQTRGLMENSQAKYGFVAFSDPEDFLKAWKEMDGEFMPPLCMRRSSWSPHRQVRWESPR